MRKPGMKLVIFTVFTVAITALLASVIGNFHPFKKRYEFEAAFEDATGTLKGDLVTLAGVDVGKVKGVRVERGLAILTLTVDEAVKLPIDSHLSIEYRNLLGQRTVQLEPGESRTYIEDGGSISKERTLGPLDLGAVLNNLRPVLTGVRAEDVNTLSSTLADTIAPKKSQIDGILSDSALLTSELSSKSPQIAGLITGVESTAGELADSRQELGRLLASFSKLSETIASRSSALDRTIVNLDAASGQIGWLIQSNRPALDQDLDDLSTLLGLVVNRQQDVNKIAAQLDDVLEATTRATTYGEWANLYVFSLCSRSEPKCDAGSASTASTPLPARGSRLRAVLFQETRP